MKWDDLLKDYKNQPVIETRMLANQPSEISKARVQLSRWVKSGKLIKIRNGLYVFPEAYRSRPVDIEYIATFACRPSYISLEYALASHGIIPEMVPNVTLVTTKRPQKLKFERNIAIYRHIDKRLFWGYGAKGEKNFETFFAEPEKALLDLFYFSCEKIGTTFFEEMRFQNTEIIDVEKMMKYASLFNSLKITKCAKQFRTFMDNEKKMREL